MKKIILFICIAVYGNQLLAQQGRSAFYDAKFLYDSCFDKEDGLFIHRTSLFDVMKKYYPAPISEADLKKNPFFGEYVPDLVSLSVDGKSSFSDGKFLSSLGGLDVTNIVTGIAQFMIKRAKEELTVAFFNRFKRFADDNPEFNVLFPKTTDNLKNLLAYKYPDMLPALRTGFLEDIKNITYHLDDVLELPKYHAMLIKFPEIRVAIRSLRLIHEIESGDSHAADVLNKFSTFSEWTEASSSNGFKNFGGSVKLAAVFSNSLRNDTAVSHNPRAWISFKQLDTLITDKILFKLYLGLVYQNVKKESVCFYITNKKITSIVRFDSLMEAQKNNLFLFQNKVTEFIELANKVDKVLDTLKDKKSHSVALSNDDYYGYIDVSMDVIEYGFSIGKLFTEGLDVDDYVAIARKSNDLYRNIYKKEYTQAVINALDIIKKVRELVKEEDENSLLVKEDNLQKITRYSLFMANMVNAKTPEEVSSLLETAALPVGSSSIKKNSAFNISVQSYLGANWRTGGLKYDNDNSWGNRWGVIAPIGVSFSYGFKKAGSLSLFGSLLDIGAIVDYQLKKDSVATSAGTDSAVVSKDYKIKLGQIFSPGAYIVYGLPVNIPLSIGFGAQYGPGLGKIETSGNTIVNNPQWRWNIF